MWYPSTRLSRSRPCTIVVVRVGVASAALLGQIRAVALRLAVGVLSTTIGEGALSECKGAPPFHQIRPIRTSVCLSVLLTPHSSLPLTPTSQSSLPPNSNHGLLPPSKRQHLNPPLPPRKALAAPFLVHNPQGDQGPRPRALFTAGHRGPRPEPHRLLQGHRRIPARRQLPRPQGVPAARRHCPHPP